jgi:hypothetical protein
LESVGGQVTGVVDSTLRSGWIKGLIKGTEVELTWDSVLLVFLIAFLAFGFLIEVLVLLIVDLFLILVILYIPVGICQQCPWFRRRREEPSRGASTATGACRDTRRQKSQGTLGTTSPAQVCAAMRRAVGLSSRIQLVSHHLDDKGDATELVARLRGFTYSSSSSSPLGRETSSSSSSCFLLRPDIADQGSN